jgi:hypothetical protein
MNSLRLQLCMDAWASIDTPIVLEGGFDLLSKLGIFSHVMRNEMSGSKQ